MTAITVGTLVSCYLAIRTLSTMSVGRLVWEGNTPSSPSMERAWRLTLFFYRTYQLIATACKDHFVRIFKLTDTVKMTAGSRVNMLNKQPAKPSGAYHVEMVAEFGQHQSEVKRRRRKRGGLVIHASCHLPPSLFF
jgi:hypothetical protein